ncbi:hypothetical protein [Halosimplex salinum]|uniref:hypothetical protein n=1 Tax=Halosimplex salinum TaxID=1710538 RepID=UPI0013DDB804|nr:hypothetical protein [Halosimplex salinum]
MWFVSLVALNFLVFPLLSLPLGISVQTLLATALGFLLAFVAIYRLDISFPSSETG